MKKLIFLLIFVCPLFLCSGCTESKESSGQATNPKTAPAEPKDKAATAKIEKIGQTWLALKKFDPGEIANWDDNRMLWLALKNYDGKKIATWFGYQNGHIVFLAKTANLHKLPCPTCYWIEDTLKQVGEEAYFAEIKDENGHFIAYAADKAYANPGQEYWIKWIRLYRYNKSGGPFTSFTSRTEGEKVFYYKAAKKIAFEPYLNTGDPQHDYLPWLIVIVSLIFPIAVAFVRLDAKKPLSKIAAKGIAFLAAFILSSFVIRHSNFRFFGVVAEWEQYREGGLLVLFSFMFGAIAMIFQMALGKLSLGRFFKRPELSIIIGFTLSACVMLGALTNSVFFWLPLSAMCAGIILTWLLYLGWTWEVWEEKLWKRFNR